MTTRRSCPPTPGPLEDYAQQFDPLFSSLAQRRGFRDYLQGLLLPRDRNKTAREAHRAHKRLANVIIRRMWANHQRRRSPTLNMPNQTIPKAA